MTKEILVLVKPWIVKRKRLHSASFRAEKIRQTKKAVLLKLKDGREEWFPWSAVERMDWVDRLSGLTKKLDHHGYLNHSIKYVELRRPIE